MKIHEIVAESSQVNEALPGVAPIVKGIAKALKPSEKTVAKRAAKDIKKATKDLEYRANKEIIKNELLRGYKFTADTLKWIGLLGSAGLPIIDYNKRMNYYIENNLATGEWSVEEFEAARRQEATVMIGKIATALVGSNIIGGLVKGTLGWMPLIGRPIKAAVDLLTPAGVIAATAWLNTDAGRRLIATIFANQAFAGGAFDLSPIIGGTVTQLIDKFKEMVPGFNKSVPPEATGPSTSNLPNKPAQTPQQQRAAQNLPVANDKLPADQTFDTTDKSYVGKYGRMTGAGLDWK